MGQLVEKLKLVLKSESPRAGRVYMTVTITSLALSVAVLAMILFSGGAEAAVNGEPLSPPDILTRTDDPAAFAGDKVDVVVAQPTELRVDVTDETAAGLIALALRERITVDTLTASFRAPDTLNVTATFSREALADFLSANGVPFASMLTLLAPRVIELDVDIALSVPQAGELSVETRSVKTNGFELSDHLPASIRSIANDALSSLISDLSALKDIEVRDGMATFILSV